MKGLYAITDGSTGNTLYTKVEAAIAGGISILQYRDKTSHHARRLAEAKHLNTLCRQHNVIFIVNDDIKLAKESQAHGVHIGKDDQALEYARTELGQHAIIGTSCYNQLLLALKAQKNGASYVAFGSMFASPTKPDAPKASIELLQEAKQKLHIPICTIGGITLDNAPQLIDNGADMVAVISHLFSQENIQTTAQEFSSFFK